MPDEFLLLVTTHELIVSLPRRQTGSSDTRFFFTPPSGWGLVIPVFFLFFFLGGHLPQTSARPKQYLSVIFVCLRFIRRNFYERWCRKLVTIEWHKSSFDESRNEDANEL